jgi:hypothetical protein
MTYQPILLIVRDSTDDSTMEFYLTEELTAEQVEKIQSLVDGKSVDRWYGPLVDYLDELDVREINEPIDYEVVA